MPIGHSFVSPKPASIDATLVDGEDWNAGHKFDLPVSLGGYLVLTNIGANYDTITQARGLGFIDMVMDGVDQIVFTVQVNKIGTGTQSWQLWNETNGAEVGVIADAGGLGIKTLTTTIVVPQPPSPGNMTGQKRLRVRAKSTNAADDPVYFGSSLLLRKTS